MYKLLFIGNPKTLMNSLSESIPWNDYGIGEVFETQDGAAALNMIRDHKLNIIIAEFKLKEIGGPELSAIIKEICNKIIVIFVIEDEEFSVLKNMYNCCKIGYLHKPVKIEELKEIIKKAVENLNKSKILTENNSRDNTAYKNGFFTKLMTSYQETESISSELAEFEIKMKFADYFIAVFALSEKNRENCKDLKYDMILLNFGLSNIIDELCDGVIHDYFVSTYCGFNIVLAVDGLKKESGIITYLFRDITKFIKESLNINIVIGVSENYHGLSNIRDAYQQAYEQVTKQKYCGCSDIQGIEHCDASEMFMEKKKILIKSIYACDTACAHEVIDWIFNMESMTGIPVKQIKVINGLLLSGLVSVVSDIDCNTSKAIGNSRSIYEKFSELRNLEYCKQFLIDIIDELIASLTDRRLMIKNDCKKSIFGYLDQNYNKDIKLYSIAEKFNIDLKDLSRMFIEDMGKGFSKYMVELKVSKAKNLLCNTEMKVYEIGRFIGYSDIKYFSKIFKELEGVTPMEYKKQMKNLKII